MDIDAGVFPVDQILKKPKKDAAVVMEAPEGETPAGATGLVDGDKVEVSPRSSALPDLPRAPEDAPDLSEGAYNIQDAKLKSELDAKLLIAQEVKDKVRVQIKGLQREYEQLLKENAGLPEGVRMSPEDIVVDVEYFDRLKKEGSEMLEEVHKECEYMSEKACKLRDKITQRMLDGLIVEEMTLSAFDTSVKGGRSTSFVRSIRTQGLSGSVLELIEMAHKQMKDNVLRENHSSLDDNESDVSSSKVMNLAKMVAEANRPEEKEEEKEEKSASAAARREMRKLRKKAILEHKKKEPKDNQDDPRDVEALRIAEETIGDYKLKVSPDYHVPEDKHTDAGKKKLQMCLLEDSLVKMRQGFNE